MSVQLFGQRNVHQRAAYIKADTPNYISNISYKLKLRPWKVGLHPTAVSCNVTMSLTTLYDQV